MKKIECLGLIYPTSKSKHKRHYGLYECPNCKKHIKCQVYSVDSGKSTQCRTCARTKHGETKTILHYRWIEMNRRCYGNKCGYGEPYKDVTVCEEWRKNFVAFRDWSLANGFSDELELDKDIGCRKLGISPKVYSPETCMWVTKSENLSERKFNG